ncbi:hypothetical protein [Plantactinospora sonchi]|uniref:Uncharacterized protein n=1 Tax=Plantactinospora sonchi TaxID=1544735 RepID=A0ABU7S2J8_9ACTN
MTMTEYPQRAAGPDPTVRAESPRRRDRAAEPATGGDRGAV